MARSVQDLQRVANAEKALASHLPFSSEIASGVIKLAKNNGFVATWELDGLPFETSSVDDLAVQNAALHQFLLGLGGGGFALWSHEIHHQVRERLADEFEHEYSQKLAAAYAQRLERTRQMRARIFMSIVYRPGEVATFGKVGLATLDAMAALEREAIDVLDDVAARMTSSLKKYKPRRLGWFKRVTDQGSEVTFSEQAAFFGFLVNGHWQDFPVIARPINNYLVTSRVTAGIRSGLLHLNMRSGEQRFVSNFEIKEYPSHVSPISLSKILYLDVEYVQTQSFSILHSRDAETRLKRQRGQMQSGGEASAGEIAELNMAIEALRSGALVFGEYHYSIALLSENLEDVKSERAEVLNALEGEFFKGELQTIIPEAAWLHQLPGNWRYRTREALLHSENFAALSPLHNFMVGKRAGNPWGPAICIFDSPSGQPFYFNFHASPDDHDSTDDKLPGNACIFGKTGSGKTTLEMFLLVHLNKYKARSFILDMDRSTEITVRRLGGIYRDFARGLPTNINPFQWPDNAANRAFLRRLIGHIVTFGRSPLESDEENQLSAVIDSVFQQPIENRRLGLMAQLLPEVERNSLKSRLSRWIGDGDLAWVLDNATDSLNLSEADTFGFDFSDFIDDAQISPVITMCLLHIFETLKDGRPLSLFMEEFWRLIADPVFSEFARDKLKTIRKENGIVIMTTQQTEDVLTSPLGATAVQQHVTGLFLPNPKASRSAYVDGFKLTDAEFELVRALPVDSRCFLVKQEERSAIVRLDLSGMQETIAVLSSDAETVDILTEIRHSVGDDPQIWEPIFLERVQQKREQKKEQKRLNLRGDV